MEHHSNIVPWHFHRERKGAVLKWAPIADDGNFLLDEFEKLLTPRTKIVAITHMSNVLGTVVPIKEIVRLAHARGIPVLVDGSAGGRAHARRRAGPRLRLLRLHRPQDLWPHRHRRAVRQDASTSTPCRPTMGGGEMIESVHTDRITYGKPPHKFEAGTPSIVQAIGLGAALDYMMHIGRDNIARHEHELKEYAHARLGQLNWLKIHGTAKDKGAIVSFSMDGVHPHDISTYIDRMGVAVRAGHHCAQPLMDRLGVTATCRASLAMYNTKAEVDALAEALIKARAFFA